MGADLLVFARFGAVQTGPDRFGHPGSMGMHVPFAWGGFNSGVQSTPPGRLSQGFSNHAYVHNNHERNTYDAQAASSP